MNDCLLPTGYFFNCLVVRLNCAKILYPAMLVRRSCIAGKQSHGLGSAFVVWGHVFTVFHSWLLYFIGNCFHIIYFLCCIYILYPSALNYYLLAYVKI